jgi:hypothetical protein
MADTKISELASATSLADSDVLCGVNSGSTKKFSLSRIREFFQKTFDGEYASTEHTHSKLSNGAYEVTIPTTIKKNDSFMLQSEKTAANISYDNSSSKMMAENVQDAITELKNGQGSGTAEDITYDNTTSKLKATNAQAAIDEVQSSLSDVKKTADSAVQTDNVGKANGVAGLDKTGVVPTAQLPTFVTGISVTVENMTICISADSSK